MRSGTRQDIWLFKFGLIGCPGKSIIIYSCPLRPKPVERSSQFHDHLKQQTAVQLNHFNKVTYLEVVAIYTAPGHCNNTNKP
jgi:hypothetical protein